MDDLRRRVVDSPAVGEGMVLPDYTGACVSGIIPALCGPGGTGDLPDWFPASVRGARQVVLLVLDGLGWEQLQELRRVTPTMSRMDGGPITTVVPSTTATALTSIATGLTPGEHGIVGYRMEVQGEVLNVLRWSTPSGDARRRFDPASLQPVRPFLGSAVPVVSRAELFGSGFTQAHLNGVKPVGYRTPSTLVVEVSRLLSGGEPLVYAYYDGVDKVAHEYGVGAHHAAEVDFADRLVSALVEVLPSGAALLITADHGQVDVRERVIRPAPEVLRLARGQSGEGRFRWLHARPGTAADLLTAATAAHGDDAWVVPVGQVLEEGWLGARVTPAAAGRLGDVALVAREPVSFDDPADTGPFDLVARHGSVTSAEMMVPLLGARA
jgi:hypothetical protein